MAAKKTPRKRRPGARPPKAVMAALLPLRVLEYASDGPGWYDRLCKGLLKGWRPRHPETDEIMNAEVCLAWAVSEFASSDTLDAMATRALRELGNVGFANMGSYLRVTSGGDPYVNLADLTPEQMAAIAEVTVEDFTDGRGEDARNVRKIKFKLYDKLSANRTILQAAGKLKDHKVLTGKDGGPIEARYDLSGLSDDELKRLSDILRRAAVAGGGGEGDTEAGTGA